MARDREVIERLSCERATFAPPPARIAAGTPSIVGTIGLAAAMDWRESLGWDA